MFRISTKQIINECRLALDDYHYYNSHDSYFFGPSQEEINQKIRFLNVLAKVHASPEEMIRNIYQFYKMEDSNKMFGLLYYLEKALFKIFQVEKKDFSFHDVYEANRKESAERERRLKILKERIDLFIGQEQEYINKISSAVKMHNYL